MPVMFRSSEAFSTIKGLFPMKKTSKRVTFLEPYDTDDESSQFQEQQQQQEPTIGTASEIWIDHDEEFSFRERDRKMEMLMRLMTPEELEIKSGESPRGLEHIHEERKSDILARRSDSHFAVFGTQGLFQRHGFDVDFSDSIARAYAKVSERATEVAIEHAKQDEKFVQEHVRVTETTSNRVFEKRDERPSLMRRQIARRSVEVMATPISA